MEAGVAADGGLPLRPRCAIRLGVLAAAARPVDVHRNERRVIIENLLVGTPEFYTGTRVELSRGVPAYTKITESTERRGLRLGRCSPANIEA